MEQALIDALNTVIDARLLELGLVTAEAEPEPAKPAKGAKGKGAKAAAPEHTLDECKEKLVELVQAQNKQAAVDLLAKYKAKKLAEIKPDQIDALYADLEEALGGEGEGGEELFE